MNDDTNRPNEAREHASLVVRFIFGTLGTLFVGIGLFGLVVPLLPTTPFLLLAAACYFRASRRLYRWLLNNPSFGPLISEWRMHRSIPWRTKLVAIATMAVTLAVSIIFFVQNGYLQVALAVMGVALAVWMYRIPSRDRRAK
jgi:uncharacterized protein